MKKNLTLLFFIINIVLLSNLHAKSVFGIKAGKNYSTFRDVETESRLGVTYGIFGEFYISNRLSINCEIQSSTKKGFINNKILGGSYVGNVYLSKINYDVKFRELLTTIKYYFPINNGIKLQFYIGPSLLIGVNDETTREKIKFLYKVENMEEWKSLHYDYVYYLGDEIFLDSSGIGLNIGIGLKWRHYTIECRYSMDMFNVEVIDQAELYKKLNSFHILFGVDFNILSKLLNK